MVVGGYRLRLGVQGSELMGWGLGSRVDRENILVARGQRGLEIKDLAVLLRHARHMLRRYLKKGNQTPKSQGRSTKNHLTG